MYRKENRYHDMRLFGPAEPLAYRELFQPIKKVRHGKLNVRRE